ncbi:myoneurin [Microdochium nivale]|nr:myoneurin [Microdochium nivale]
MVASYGTSFSPSRMTASQSPSPFSVTGSGYAEEEFGRPSYAPSPSTIHDQQDDGYHKRLSAPSPSSLRAQRPSTRRAGPAPAPHGRLHQVRRATSFRTDTQERAEKGSGCNGRLPSANATIQPTIIAEHRRCLPPKQVPTNTTQNNERPAAAYMNFVLREGHSGTHQNPTIRTSSSYRSATEEDARHRKIPKGYSLEHWDPREEPILLLGSVFDCNSLGKWIYDWVVYRDGPESPTVDTAGDLWLLLIQLYGNVKKSEETIPGVRLVADAEILEDFVQAGWRLMDKFCKLLKHCRQAMLRAQGNQGHEPEARDSPQLNPERKLHGRAQADFPWLGPSTKKGQLGENSAVAFIDTLLGRYQLPDQTESLMRSMSVFGLRFDINCRAILCDPGASLRVAAQRAHGLNGQSGVQAEGPPLLPDEIIEYAVLQRPTPQTPAGEVIPTMHSNDSRDVSSPSTVATTSEDTDDDTVRDFLPFSNPNDSSPLHRNHPFRQGLLDLVDVAVDQYMAWRAHGGSSQPPPVGKRRRARDDDRNSCSKYSKNNHKKDKDSRDDDEDDEESKDHKRARGSGNSTDLPEVDDTSPTLGCPFYKHDKLQHDRCLYLQLKRIKDVKQHLRRAHAQPHFCPICGTAFADSKEALDEHIIARTCEQRVFIVPEGVTDSHRAKFTQRVARTLSLSEQWFTVWDILFPDTPRPESAFVDGPVAEVSAEIVRWWNRHGQSIVSDHIEAHGGAEEFERRVRNYERDLATLFVSVGRNVLERVIERMRDGRDDNGGSSDDDAVASEAQDTEGIQPGLSGSSSSTKATSVSISTRRDKDEARDMGTSLDEDAPPAANAPTITEPVECSAPWHSTQDRSLPDLFAWNNIGTHAEINLGHDVLATHLPSWWDMPGFDIDAFS